MKLRKRNKGESGFTLIELIAVIIILGILAAVIVPKYFDMTDKARDAAAKGAMAEGAARLNMAYSQYILNTNSKPSALANLQDSALLGADLNSVSIGDYSLKYAVSGSSVAITVSSSAGSTLGSTTIPWPN